MKGKLSKLIYKVANERIQGSWESMSKVLEEVDAWEQEINGRIALVFDTANPKEKQ